MASSLSKATQWARARYGAGMIPGRSVKSAKSSGEHLKESRTGAGSSGITANILPPTLKTKSSSHCTVSATCGKERQQRRTKSMVIARPRRGRPLLGDLDHHDAVRGHVGAELTSKSAAVGMGPKVPPLVRTLDSDIAPL